MVAIAVLLLTVVHPAIFFPILRKPKKNALAASVDAEKKGLQTSTPSEQNTIGAESGDGSSERTA
jgi:hypothetical protein